MQVRCSLLRWIAHTSSRVIYKIRQKFNSLLVVVRYTLDTLVRGFHSLECRRDASYGLDVGDHCTVTRG